MSLPKKLFIFIDKSFDQQQNRRKKFNYADENVIVNKDIVYDASDKDVCKLDTYRIQNDGSKYPVFFYIHGGGFVAGDKHFRRNHASWVAKEGYFVVNVNYALAPENKFPSAVRNLVSALNWVDENAEKLNLDMNKIIVSGDSAGGYYSALLACVTSDKKLQERLGVSTEHVFQGAILNCGIYDVGSALKRYMPFNLTDKICFDFSGVHAKDFDSYEWKDICAPIALVTADFPASFITYADKDIFCKGQGLLLINKLKEVGVHVEEFHSVKLLNNHCFSLGWKGSAPEENNKLTKDFLKRFKEGKI